MRSDLPCACVAVTGAWNMSAGWVHEHLLVMVLAIWTFACLWGIARAFDRTWFRRVAVLTVLGDAAFLTRQDDVLKAVGDLVTGGTVPFVPEHTPADQVGWVVLVVLLVCCYRLLEIVNARRTLATLAVDKVVDENGAWQAGLESVLRDAINRASPHSTSRYPGGGVEYLEVNGGFASTGWEPSWWAAKLGVWALRAAFPQRTLKVSGALVPKKLRSERPQDAEAAGITVTVEDARTKAVVFTRTVRAENLQDAVEQAGYRVADFAIRRCPTLPGWASWDEGKESSTFLEYWRGVRERKFSQESLKAAERNLRVAVGLSPSSALPRLQLAAVLEAQRRYVEAIEMCANVASRYPLLFDARYRLALLLRKAGHRNDAAPGEQRRLTEALKAPIRGLPAASTTTLDAAASSDRLYDMARRLQEQLVRDFSWWRIAWCCLRDTAERRYLAPRYLYRWQRRKAARAAMQTAECCTRLLLQPPAPPGGAPSKAQVRAMRAIEHDARNAVGERRGERRRVERGWWGIPHYNLACLYMLWLHVGASRDDALREEAVEKAVRHLELAELDPHGPFSSGSLGLWTLSETLEALDDFEAVRGEERFKNWRARAFAAAAAPAATRPRSAAEAGLPASRGRESSGFVGRSAGSPSPP